MEKSPRRRRTYGFAVEGLEDRTLPAANIFQINSAIIRELANQGVLARQQNTAAANAKIAEINALEQQTRDALRQNTTTDLFEAFRSGPFSDIQKELNDNRQIGADLAKQEKAKADILRELVQTNGDITRSAAEAVTEYVTRQKTAEQAKAEEIIDLSKIKVDAQGNFEQSEDGAAAANGDAQSRVGNRGTLIGVFTGNFESTTSQGTVAKGQIQVTLRQLDDGVTIIGRDLKITGLQIVQNGTVVQTVDSVGLGTFDGNLTAKLSPSATGHIAYTFPPNMPTGFDWRTNTQFSPPLRISHDGTGKITGIGAEILVNGAVTGSFILTAQP